MTVTEPKPTPLDYWTLPDFLGMPCWVIAAARDFPAPDGYSEPDGPPPSSPWARIDDETYDGYRIILEPWWHVETVKQWAESKKISTNVSKRFVYPWNPDHNS